MTPEMIFEGLVVSQDSQILSTMNRVLDGFSIKVDFCLRPSRALSMLSGHNVDVVVLDWENDNSALEIVDWISKTDASRKPTFMAIIDKPVNEYRSRELGLDFVTRKPLTTETGTRWMRTAYGKMVRDYRRYTRHGLMKAVSATKDGHRYFAITVLDIGEGGVGLITKENLQIGDNLKFALSLGTEVGSIQLMARILWTKHDNLAGAEFVGVSHSDLRILYRWLWAKCLIKRTRKVEA
jgi:response regulator RpfG family c-di-GMP phosphodiesterase